MIGSTSEWRECDGDFPGTLFEALCDGMMGVGGYWLLGLGAHMPTHTWMDTLGKDAPLYRLARQSEVLHLEGRGFLFLNLLRQW